MTVKGCYHSIGFCIECPDYKDCEAREREAWYEQDGWRVVKEGTEDTDDKHQATEVQHP